MTAVTGDLEARFLPGSRPRVHVSGPLELRGPFAASGFYYLRNVTAGVFSGDRYRTAIHCASGASARIESSSASKVYSMPEGLATSRVELCAEPGSRLVWGPHATVLHTGASLSQDVLVTLSPGAGVLLAESVVMGRVAAGERFDFTRYVSKFEVRDAASVLLFREAYDLTPGPLLEASMGGLCVLTCVYALGDFAAAAGRRLENAWSRSALTGWSLLPGGCGLVAKSLNASLSQGAAWARLCLSALDGAPSCSSR